ncbi:HlyD family type I secretion periplasmic adaptor subunit [Terrihabitans rhizophilus]|uniref:Membrane fusion protein (MFP) family protein n=1 Tax=Terrihabitans rhizophilus TaxID=3092662 RepID=A0ABU4RPY8_9HYPH|nr:HlyD family type I secretion periplasmic adaptor subunit [Terrihabitans sp. PJ23]MDX6806915.1 HlyD family type I secretion periplasmic adaptor subunit [Terrihabitans sp. PJ23]
MAAASSFAFGDTDDVRLARSMRAVWMSVAAFLVFGAWAYFAVLDEVSTGSGRVVPSLREQVIQSLEGGILSSLRVKQDDIVEPGQLIAQLDPTITESDVEENAAKYRAALARSARLTAEVDQTALSFPPELDTHPELKAAETQLYQTRRKGLDDSLRWISESMRLVQEELKISQSLSSIGAASNVEVIRLKRQMAELELKQVEVRNDYLVSAREELAKASAEIKSLTSVIKGRTDALSRLNLRSPVRGIVKNIEVSTIGGVIPPNGKLMDIVPLDDRLLIEARIAPRDIAYIHPNQAASVKVTAYDYSIYGDLKGLVTTISPDTIQDEADPQVYYYRVFIRTESDALVNKAGQRFPISPGMVATVDIHTGSKTVLDYLIKPLNRAQEALRER